MELRRKGIASELITRAVEDVDDYDTAYRAAMSKIPKITTDEYQIFRRRLGDFLKRRGFGYEVIQQTVEKLWSERGENFLRKYKEDK